MDRRTSIKTIFTGTTLSILGIEAMAFDGILIPKANSIAPQPLYLFAKVLQWVPLEDQVKTVQDLGFSGIDVAVRDNGLFKVQEIKSKLPVLVKDSQKLKMGPVILTTSQSIENLNEMEEFLKAISGEGVYDYRMGWLKFKSTDILRELKGFNQQMKRAAELHEKYGVTGHYQNHAGNGVGGSVWEIHHLLEGIDPQHIGVQFDLRHATVEGYRSYENVFHLIQEKIKSFDLKDFIWEKGNNKENILVNVPLGEGNVNFKLLFENAGFKSPGIPKILHVEYDLGGAEHGNKNPGLAGKKILSAIKADVSYYYRHFG